MTLASKVLEHIAAANKRAAKCQLDEESGVSYYPRSRHTTTTTPTRGVPSSVMEPSTTPSSKVKKRPKTARPPSPMQLSDPAPEPGSPGWGSPTPGSPCRGILPGRRMMIYILNNNNNNKE